MKITSLPLLITLAISISTASYSAPADYFHEATVAISRANRLEKAGKINEAKQALKEATSALQRLKNEDAHWFPDWVNGKESDIDTIANRLKSTPIAPTENKVDYSLKPGEWRDVTIERAYKAHAEGRAEIPPHARGQLTSPTPRRVVTSPQNKGLRSFDKPIFTKPTSIKHKESPTIQLLKSRETKPVQARKVIEISKKEQPVQEITPIQIVPKEETPKPFQKPKQKRRVHRFRIGD